MFITLFIFSLILIAIALIGLGIQIFFSKKKKFPETRIGHNKNLRKKKIYCMKTEQVILDKKYKQVKGIKTICSDC
ncbi:MAG: hypothetical protein J7K64_02035 [Bacteroidales bacterium]|nr:hypothetical protein [Bacteroidales bacterium]